MRDFNISQAHKLVNTQRALGNDCRWDGWDIVFFRPSDNAVWSNQGARRNGVWGFDNRFKVNSEGKWNIDERNIWRSRGSRSRRG